MRSVRRLSQREFAARAGVPPSTVDRIEAGRSDPRLSTFVAMVRAGGYHLVVADRYGRPLASRKEIEELFDRAGRRLPAHLKSGPTPSYFTKGRQWWGWHHIAFPLLDDNVPENTYWRRPPRWFHTWEDAT
jgi:transcriptional regulator with XRE-family HTH domain